MSEPSAELVDRLTWVAGDVVVEDPAEDQPEQ